MKKAAGLLEHERMHFLVSQIRSQDDFWADFFQKKIDQFAYEDIIKMLENHN